MTMLTELEDQGWTIDKWGNAKLTHDNGKVLRWKFQHHTIRVEVQVELNGRKEWLRLETIKYENQ